MIGFKYTNIKIQTAYIKYLMYSYLYNLFLLKPGFYYQFILTEFSKDSLSGENSKEQFDNFISKNKVLVDTFYLVVEQINKSLSGKDYKENNIIKYMWLTCVLNKDMKTNFNFLTDEEIENIGRQEIINLLFDIFFVVLENIKEKHKLNINEIKDLVYKEAGTTTDTKTVKNDLAKIDTKFDGSIENLIDSCFFMENTENIYNFQDRPVFITYTDNDSLTQEQKENVYKSGVSQQTADKFTQALSKHGDFPTKINELLNQEYAAYQHPYNDYEIKAGADSYELLKNDLLKIPEDIGYKGFGGQVFFKIKDQVDVQFRCGSEASKNPVTISFRSSKDNDLNNHDFIYVQKFFDWKKDKSYFDLEQFIFVRQENIKNILKYDEINKGTINLQKNFDEKSHLGIKFIEGNDIYTLEDKLKNSLSDLGFLALVPIRRTEKNLINDLLANQNLNLYVGIFSDLQRELRMSYGDLTRLLCKNYKFDSNSYSKFAEDKNYIPKTLSNIDLGKRNIDLNDLIDCYFSIYLNEFVLGKYKLTGALNASGLPSKTRYTADEIASITNQTAINERKLKITNDVKTKEGTFSLLLENAIQPKTVSGKTDKTIFYLKVEKKFVSSIKIKTKNKKIFQNFDYGYSSFGDSINTLNFYNLIDFTDLETSVLLFKEKGNLGSLSSETKSFIFLQHIKQNFSNEIVESFRNEIPKEEKEILDAIFPSLNDPQENLLMKLTTTADLKLVVNNYIDANSKFKSTRAYKNVVDFLIYYKNSVESLARELQDNV